MPIFSGIVKKYIEETPSSILLLAERIETDPIVDINTLVATGPASLGQGGTATVPPYDLTTVQENSVVAVMPAIEDYIDHGGFGRSQVVEYTVQPGDLISFIASDYGVSINSILWANNLSDPDTIKPGQILRIPPVTGVIHKVSKSDTVSTLAEKYGAEAEKIIAFNDLSLDGTLEIGEEIIIPGGRMSGSSETQRDSAKTITIKAGKSFAYLPDLGDYFIKPTSGFNWGIIHGRNAIDVANSCGTPIFAAAGGYVAIVDGVGWNGGLGKYLKIVHPNGTETLYAHLQKIEVKLGEIVGKGQLIGLMGTTGKSTGCHLHFEVHGARNPLARY